jgi:hypothetical protein
MEKKQTAVELYSHLYGKEVTMDDRFETKVIWSEELALNNNGKWIPKEVTMSKQTAVTLLFQEFKALSEVMRKAGDEKNANLIDCLCEREEVAKQMEKEQIKGAWYNGISGGQCGDSEQYYNETYGGKK